MLLRLRRLLKEKGRITKTLVDKCPYTPCHNTYKLKFGSLEAACSAIGYASRWMLTRRRTMRWKDVSDEEMIAKLVECYAKHGDVNAGIIDAEYDMPKMIQYLTRFGSLIEAYRLAQLPIDRFSASNLARH